MNNSDTESVKIVIKVFDSNDNEIKIPEGSYLAITKTAMQIMPLEDFTAVIEQKHKSNYKLPDVVVKSLQDCFTDRTAREVSFKEQIERDKK